MQPFQKIDRRYQVLSPLGSGITGEIYKVEGPDGIVALKLLKTHVPGLKPEERITTFKFEFSLLKGLSHPNIVRIFDFGFDETLKRFYFTEELVEGTSIVNLFKNTAAIRESHPLHRIKDLFVQALQGLAYLHSHDVIHGDIKPDNLLVTSPASGHPLLKIIDFGISHPSLAGYAGTPASMAPEKILKEPADTKSDLYSLAVVFYSLLCGENPFVRKTVLGTLQAHLKFTPPSATAVRPEVDPVWSELLSLMLQKNPRYRIDSAEACLKFLETKGEVHVSPQRQRLLPKIWIGRTEILQEAKDFLKKLSSQPKHSLLAVIGEKGLGRESLLTELKYEAELMGIEVISSIEEEPTRTSALCFVKEMELDKILEERKLKDLLNQFSCLISLDPEFEKKLGEKLLSYSPHILRLRPLTIKETEDYLKDVTRNHEIPTPFLQALHRLSRGFPEPLNEALQHLLMDPLIVDSSGKWNLAVFREAEPTLEQLGFSAKSLAHALSGDLGGNVTERFHLNSQRAEALAKQGKLDEALSLLNKLEEELKIFERPRRLLERAGLLGIRGWIYTKLTRYQEARESFASALSLIKESETPSGVLEIRLKNYLAFLDLQEGRTPEAISQYEQGAKLVKTLSENQQREVTNNELGQALLAAGRIQEAIARLREDLKFYKTLADPSYLMKASYNLGEAFTQEKNFSEASKAYERVAKIARTARDWDYLIRAYNGLGNICSLEKNFSASLDYYQRSLHLAEYLRDYLCAATVAQNLGAILSESERLDESLQNLEISKQLLNKVHPSSHSRYLMARATLELGEVYRKKKDLPMAKTCFTEALNRSEEDPNLKNFCFYPLHSLAGTALEENDFESFRELYPKLVHSATTEEDKQMLSQLLAKAPSDPTKGQESSLHEKIIGESSAFLNTFPQEALSQVLKINRALLTEHEPEQLFQKILGYATDLSRAETALLLEIDEAGKLQVIAAFNTQVDQGQKEISEKIAQRVLQTGESLVTPDAQLDSGFNQYQSVIALHLRSVACFPIRIHQKVMGLLYLTHRYQSNLFTPEMIRVLEAFGDQAGLALQNANYVRQLQKFNEQLKQELENAEEEIDRLKIDLRGRVKNPYPKILGKSRAIVEILKSLDRISDTNLSVLVLGETGSGKELVARSIHDNSRRRKGPFIAVNCGAIPENLIESEFFGYRAGAFTGATRDKKGLIEAANGGTLFLDEIADLPLQTQVKLLRALQEKEIRRLGDHQSISIDLRIVTATNHDLESWVQTGKFRDDLYYRIAQMILKVPSLREHKEDLLLLSEHFLKASAKELGLEKIPHLGKDLLEKMLDYDWPGNVRELENLIHTASAFAERGIIHLGNLPEFLSIKLKEKMIRLPTSTHLPTPTSLHQGILFHPEWSWDQYEEALIAKALLKHEMNCENVAKELGVGIATVYLKLRKYSLKNNAARWENIPFPTGMKVAELKQAVIEESYRQNNQSPYAVAKQLGLNVGTIYRQLR